MVNLGSRRRQSGRRTKPLSIPEPQSTPPASQLALADIEVLERLSNAYQVDLEEKQIGYQARYKSIRESACASVFLILLLQVIGIAFFRQNIPDVSVADAVLFSTYSITSAGYGSVTIPHTTGFLFFVIFYMFTGVIFLAVLVAQTYQYLTLASQRSQHARDKMEGAKRGVEQLNAILQCDSTDINHTSTTSDSVVRKELHRSLKQIYEPARRLKITRLVKQDRHSGVANGQNNKISQVSCWDKCARLICTKNSKGNVGDANDYEQSNKMTELGRALLVATILSFCLLLMTFGMMILEGWTYSEALYFSIYSMTTTGYGDYAPTTDASKWFASCTLWLNVLFMALYLSNVAHYFVMISNLNIRRIEKNLRLEKKEKDNKNERMRQLMEGVSRTVVNANDAKTATLVSSLNTGELRAKRLSILDDVFSSSELFLADDSEIAHQERDSEQEMQQILDAVHEKIDQAGKENDEPLYKYSSNAVFGRNFEKSALLYQSTSAPSGPASLALRILVEERAARIIAADIAGFECSSEIKDESHLLLMTERLHDVANDWSIPHLARRAFYAVAMKALCVVGENHLLTSGAEAFFKLSTAKFSTLFAPFSVALGGANTMENWMQITEQLANDRLSKKQKPIRSQTSVATNTPSKKETGLKASESASNLLAIKPRRVLKEPVDDFFPPNQGNAGLIEHRANKD